ncbi:MAG: hypothetical protein J6O62_02485 [Bacilli bacterium]|nr:hypothetical protein [Bacilli bacterium]MBO6195532.1 hypothetical protein [Bacilli bacterium]
MQSIIKLLTNNVISIWVAPIITTVIGSIIYGIIKFQSKRDSKLIKEANDRYLNCIRQYIIQGIKIKHSVIRDIRSVIIKESGLKEKFIYDEVSLRDKLISDISEDKYINEKEKVKLINLTYDSFKSYDKVIIKEESSNTIIDMILAIVLIILTICLGVTITFLGQDRFIMIDFHASIIIFILIVLMVISVILVLNKNSAKEKFISFFFDEIEEDKDKK